ncbi:hypothetical protein [Actinoplanes derwentensis]|uniref:Uncharacterized protein n=1 Tax=Actinoplanes derwentensis TaxID=113562 RepID=A0A1H1ZSV7_9ACTN|nr:hypothetical protein [Actinoplanes derwentensis]GID83569.1 hypothetical protein Ade03nite_24930 [Actinoplanes derwentensis]SDT36689.1 hypothetical protein SAMN04489716_3475 [Actinoplanes derwentensis]
MAGGDVAQRPQYLGSDRLDDLARMILELTTELWILKDRTIVLEHLLAEHGVVSPGAVDLFQPGTDLAQSLRDEREALVRRVMGAVLTSDERLALALGKK